MYGVALNELGIVAPGTARGDGESRRRWGQPGPLPLARERTVAGRCPPCVPCIRRAAFSRGCASWGPRCASWPRRLSLRRVRLGRGERSQETGPERRALSGSAPPASTVLRIRAAGSPLAGVMSVGSSCATLAVCTRFTAEASCHDQGSLAANRRGPAKPQAAAGQHHGPAEAQALKPRWPWVWWGWQ